MSVVGQRESVDSENAKSYELSAKSEFRFELDFDTSVTLRVVEGFAEIFGTELPNDTDLVFQGCKSSIYTHKGCKIKFSHEIDSSYVSEESSMGAYLNLHFGLEKLRQDATNYNKSRSKNIDKTAKGPRVLIIGGHDSGKSSIMKVLSSYANKMDRTPLLVNLDPSKGVFGLPGSLTSTPISDMLNVESTFGYGGTTTSGPTYHHPKQPVVKNYGLEGIQENLRLYKYQVSRLGLASVSRLEEDIAIKNSGILIDTPPLALSDSELIDDIISDFEVNLMIIVGNEKLVIDLKRKFKEKLNAGSLSLLKIPKSGGVVETEDAFMRSAQQKVIREYFYGDQKNVLSPFNVSVEFKDVMIYKAAEVNQETHYSFLPIGETMEDEEKEKESEFSKMLVKVEPTSAELSNSILSIMHLSRDDFNEDDLLNASVMGYAYVSDVDDTKQKIRMLLPVPGRLPNNILILSKFRYHE